MNTILATLGAKITERVVARMTMPGLFYILITLWSVHAGHHHAFDITYLADSVQSRLGDVRPTPVGVGIIVALAAATTAGLLATVVGQEVVGRVWIMRAAPAWWLTRRQRAWQRRTAGRDPKPPTRYRPHRLTPIGDSFRLVGERLDAQYGLSIPDAWPRLTVLAGPDTNALVTNAYRAYRADTTIAAWAVLLTPVAVWWWPAGLIAVAGFAIGFLRCRTSAAALASLIESVVDTHQKQLADAVGVDLPAGRLTPAEGPHINNILTKRG